MKKQLMTTTALVAAGLIASSGAALAGKPKMTVGGNFEAIIGTADVGNKTNTGGQRVFMDVQQDAEIHFKGSVKLDNGIKIATRVELEGTSANASDTIDEAFMTISGKFGQLRIGSEDNAAHLTVTGHSGSWATNVGQNLNFDVGDWIETPSGHRASTVQRLDLGEGDSEKLTYFTPRIGGFTVGLSYMPSQVEGGNGDIENTGSGMHSGFAASIKYAGKMGALKLGAAAGYAQYKPATGTAGAANREDPRGYAVGIKATMGKITVGFGTGSESNISSDATASATRGNSYYDMGVKYDAGKNKFSLGYMMSQDAADSTVAGDDETAVGMLSYRRVLGKGVQWRANVMYGDFDGENAASTDDNDGYAITTSIRIGF